MKEVCIKCRYSYEYLCVQFWAYENFHVNNPKPVFIETTRLLQGCRAPGICDIIRLLDSDIPERPSELRSNRKQSPLSNISEIVALYTKFTHRFRNVGLEIKEQKNQMPALCSQDNLLQIWPCVSSLNSFEPKSSLLHTQNIVILEFNPPWIPLCSQQAGSFSLFLLANQKYYCFTPQCRNLATSILHAYWSRKLPNQIGKHLAMNKSGFAEYFKVCKQADKHIS